MSVEEARRTADKAWEHYKKRFEKFGPKLDWTDDAAADFSFRTRGLGLTGRLEIKPGRIDVSLDVPMVLRLFKKIAVAAVEKEIRRWEDPQPLKKE